MRSRKAGADPRHRRRDTRASARSSVSEPLHERYVTEVSNRYWAASLQLSAFLWHLCRTIDARSVLELGSGFTTYVFRRYAAESSHDVRVLSADTDEAWVERTLTFLGSTRPDKGELVPLRTRRNDQEGPVRPRLQRRLGEAQAGRDRVGRRAHNACGRSCRIAGGRISCSIRCPPRPTCLLAAESSSEGCVEQLGEVLRIRR